MSVCTPKSFDLTGKVALITGASYGIGFAIATAMANCGATIVFNDIKQELVDKGLAAYKEAGIEAHGYVCDVTNEDAVNEMVKKITAEVGHINVLVNNAGIIKRIPMIEMTAAQFRQVIDVDLNAPFIVAKAVIPDMIKQGGGKIINICSMMSELGRETVSAHSTRLHLHLRRDVLEGFLPDIKRSLVRILHLLAQNFHRIVEDGIGNTLLTIQHEVVDEPGHKHVTELGIWK